MDDKTNGWFIGKAIDEIWDFKVEGIWQVNEADEAALAGQRPGDPKVSNIYTADDIINKDGTRTPVYNDNDKVFQGKKTPPIYWNLRNNFTIYKIWIYFSPFTLTWDTKVNPSIILINSIRLPRSLMPLIISKVDIGFLRILQTNMHA